MKRVSAALLAFTMLLLSFGGLTASAQGDGIRIISMTPDYFSTYGKPITFSVEIEYELASAAEGLICLGFNNGEENCFYFVDDRVTVTRGQGSCTLTGTVAPVNWADTGIKGWIDKAKSWLGFGVPAFAAYVGLSTVSAEWNPLADETLILEHRPNDPVDPSVFAMHPPIIIVPGIMGSRLLEGDRQIWPPIVWPPADFSMSLDRMAIDNPLRVPDYKKNLQLLPVKDREYGANDTYKSLCDKLSAAFPERAIYFFSYDFRQSNQDSAEVLENFVNGLGVDKVDLVCHSMGGLVASQYIARNPANGSKIRRIVTLGTPYEGAPMLLHVAAMGDLHQTDSGFANVLDKLFDEWPKKIVNLVALLSGLTFSVRTGMPGSAELSPTLDFAREYPFKTDFLAYKAAMKVNDYQGILTGLFSAIPYSRVLSAQNDIKSGNGAGVLSSHLNSNFLVGNGKRTITSVTFLPGTFVITDLGFGSGDGTVPYESATMLGNMPQSKVTVFQADHGELAAREDCVKEVIAILRTDENFLYTGEPAVVASAPYTVIRAACPVDVTVRKNGETLSNAPEAFSESAGFGEMYLLGESGEIKLFVLDDGDYDVSMHGTGNGMMEYSIRYYDAGNRLKEERSVKDVPITPNTVISTGTRENQKTTLEVDANGDGTVDQILEAEIQKDSTRGGSLVLILLIAGGAILLVGLIFLGIKLLRTKKKPKTKFVEDTQEDETSTGGWWDTM